MMTKTEERHYMNDPMFRSFTKYIEAVLEKGDISLPEILSAVRIAATNYAMRKGLPFVFKVEGGGIEPAKGGGDE